MRFAHILVKHKYEIEDLQKHLEGGQVFADLAKKYSICPSAAQGGDLGEVKLSRFVEEFAEAAANLNPDEISPPVRTKFGYHLILRLR